MDVDSDVPLLCDDWLARVSADAYTHRAIRETGLRVACCGDGVRHACERDEECISLRVNLHPAVPRERGAQHTTMLVENVRVSIAELVQQTRRALDVG
jgi:hypothetical protein